MRTLLVVVTTLLLGACGHGEAVTAAVTPPAATLPPSATTPPPALVPVPPVAPPPAEPVPPVVPSPPPDPLAPWFAGGFASKTVVVWGNSTVSHAVYFFDELKRYAVPGEPLEGLDPARVLNYGNNGASLAALLDGQGSFPVTAVIAARPDLLIIRGPLINDVRLGGTSLHQAKQLLLRALDQLRAEIPAVAILLTTENSLLTTDVGGFGWVQPNTSAQQYTDILREAVLAMDGRYPNVQVYDVMALEYGVSSPATSVLMANQLHPNEAGQREEARLVLGVIGKR